MIREAKIEDVQKITPLVLGMMNHHRAIDDNYKSADEFGDIDVEIKNWMKDPNIKIFIAEADGEIFGYLRASINESPKYQRDANLGMIDDVFIKPNKRKSGLATELFSKAKKWFLARGVTHAELNVHIKNPTAVALWRKLGFKDYKIRMKIDL